MSGQVHAPGVAAVGVSKAFPGVRALESVTFEMRAGVVTGLVGPNGAGKSTLIGVLTGRLQPDRGHVEVDGERVHFRAVRDAIAAGIQVIPQELTIARGLTVGENLLMGRLPHRGPMVDVGELSAEADRLAARVGLDGGASRPVDELSPVEMRLVMIGRATARECRYLIMDEPTASLSPREVGLIFDITQTLAQEGVGIVYVSHRLSEVKALCSDVTVLRDGHVVHTDTMAHLHVPDLVRLMSDVEADRAGDEEASSAATPTRQPGSRGDVIIRARGLARGIVQPADIDVHAGEVVGIAGLVGSGRTELVRMLAGADEPERGTLEWNGAIVDRPGIRLALAQGVVLLPEDRRAQGGFQDLSVAANVTISALGRFSRWRMFLRLRREQNAAEAALTQLGVPTRRLNDPMRTLSGGNQQKVLIAKWMMTKPRVFLFDEPTAGIDVHTKDEIRRELWRLAATGAGVVVVSSDNEELPALCDRVVVLCEGRISGEIVGDAISPRAILELSYGGMEVPIEDRALG